MENALSHEFNDEVFNLKEQRAIDAEVEANEIHNEQYELAHRYAPEGFDFYAQYEYL